MSITTTSNLGPLINQSVAPFMLYVPTPMMNYMTIADHVAMPPNGGTTMLFAQPVALQPPTIQLGNTGIDKRCVDLKSWVIDLEFLAA